MTRLHPSESRSHSPTATLSPRTEDREEGNGPAAGFQDFLAKSVGDGPQVPDVLGILADGAVAGELAGASYVQDGFLPRRPAPRRAGRRRPESPGRRADPRGESTVLRRRATCARPSRADRASADKSDSRGRNRGCGAPRHAARRSAAAGKGPTLAAGVPVRPSGRRRTISRGQPPRASSMLAPSRVPTVSAPLRANFMLLVPDASVPAVEICSLTSAAGTMASASVTR